MSLENKVAVVTGASSGIGKETALKLGGAGAKVALLARREEKLKAVASQIEDNGGEALALKTDVTVESQVKSAIERTAGTYSRIDILVNIAGLGIFKPVEKLSVDEWNKQVDVMLTGAFMATHYALPHIYRLGKGRVLFITSLWGPVKTAADCSAYNAAKAGVSALASALREEIREKALEVGVSEIRPGTVATEFFDKAEYKGSVNPDKVLHAEDVADAILEAISSRNPIAHNVVELEGTNPPY